MKKKLPDGTEGDWEQGPGPWDGERDEVRVKWGKYELLAKRNLITGAWLGYVGVREGHRWFGVDYNDISADVHGGLTYSGTHWGESGDVWWVGFDCAHFYTDIVPGFKKGEVFSYPGATYKDLPFVWTELYKLAARAARANKGRRKKPLPVDDPIEDKCPF